MIRTFLLYVLPAAVVAAAVLAGWSAPAMSAPADAAAPLRSVSTRFVASRDGFAFINHAAGDRRTLLGKAVVGLCGGMSYAALDYFRAGRSPATSGIDRFLIQRNVESVAANWTSFVVWTLAPDTPSPGGALAVVPATRSQLGELARKLREGPVPLGLVKSRELRTVGENHQVVAYALERKGSTVVVRVYDPNHPRSDDAYLALDLVKPGAVQQYVDGELRHSWRGFFVEHYSPVAPPLP